MAESIPEKTIFPRGWFAVGYSDEIKSGEVKGLAYFGTKYAAFRDEEGKLSILDAYCPHLGADMSVGGKVESGCIRCPFHAWKFDGSGKCTEVPYAKKIPRGAKVGSHPVSEVNGIVFMWHDPSGEEPHYEIPVVEQHSSDDWLDWSINSVVIKTHPREVVENVADAAHFPTVHNTHVDKFDNIYEEHKATQLTEGIAYPRGGGEDKFTLNATYHGPAYQVTYMKGVIESIYFQAHTPIDENTLQLRFGVSLPVLGGDTEKSKKFAAMYVQNLTTGYHEDIQIWEHKTYKDRPILAPGDGPIGKLRKWYSQFFIPRAE
ncbi:MAG: aromatic ring-hydroxylating dioxygenase subunit alpha [Deltaproteobacteria bacterium]|nr:aromatic ring-hydroxylating dioxygenase subunit alpha [Deltaproteobacteria bacterium]MBT6436019.1 aromatic ring-hydroxylating dioxygenase subunit alpha [Deltaproteobacteria bacterium]MBT6492045.1 aromatic ring-hydroxylating dioxygenase subunit alpha [Deltaproteobacteria bacterium]